MIEGVGLVADAVGWAFPYIQGVIEQVWAVIGPIVQGLADAFGGAVKAVSGAVSKVRGIFGSGKSKETPAANAHRNIILFRRMDHCRRAWAGAGKPAGRQ